jgi:uncharacterized protein YneF (UPF0154 family)
MTTVLWILLGVVLGVVLGFWWCIRGINKLFGG